MIVETSEELMFIDRMKGHDYIDATRKYLSYLEEHLNNVRVAHSHLSNACKDMWWTTDDFFWHTLLNDVKHHDLSKFSENEFVQYRKHFYPIDGEIPSDFDSAWENHKRENHHHWETVSDEYDLVHMIIDWTAMSYKFGGSAQSYYEKNAATIHISDYHKKYMYEIFEKIAEYEKNQG